jgi:pilus assembly protein TadC
LLAAGGVAFTTHAGKAGTRLAVGATGGHFLGLGIALSLAEDLLAFLVAPLSLLMPLLILALVIVAVVGIVLVSRSVRRRRRAVSTRP